MIWTAPGKCLIAWDMGQGPTFDTDARSKALGECEVWRAQDPENLGGAAVCIGETKAEAFLDTNAQDGACYYYWVMERMSSGGLRQIGPVLDVEMPYSWEYPWDIAPTEPDDVTATGTNSGIRLDWKAPSTATTRTSRHAAASSPTSSTTRTRTRRTPSSGSTRTASATASPTTCPPAPRRATRCGR